MSNSNLHCTQGCAKKIPCMSKQYGDYVTEWTTPKALTRQNTRQWSWQVCKVSATNNKRRSFHLSVIFWNPATTVARSLFHQPEMALLLQHQDARKHSCTRLHYGCIRCKKTRCHRLLPQVCSRLCWSKVGHRAQHYWAAHNKNEALQQLCGGFHSITCSSYFNKYFNRRWLPQLRDILQRCFHRHVALP